MIISLHIIDGLLFKNDMMNFLSGFFPNFSDFFGFFRNFPDFFKPSDFTSLYNIFPRVCDVNPDLCKSYIFSGSFQIFSWISFKFFLDFPQIFSDILLMFQVFWGKFCIGQYFRLEHFIQLWCFQFLRYLLSSKHAPFYYKDIFYILYF